jgi:hypothetical protein
MMHSADTNTTPCPEFCGSRKRRKNGVRRSVNEWDTNIQEIALDPIGPREEHPPLTGRETEK